MIVIHFAKPQNTLAICKLQCRNLYPTIDLLNSYWIGSDSVHISQEYQIYDIDGVVGSTGGTLGLFLGFSFLNLFQSIFVKLKNHMVAH